MMLFVQLPIHFVSVWNGKLPLLGLVPIPRLTQNCTCSKRRVKEKWQKLRDFRIRIETLNCGHAWGRRTPAIPLHLQGCPCAGFDKNQFSAGVVLLPGFGRAGAHFLVVAQTGAAFSTIPSPWGKSSTKWLKSKAGFFRTATTTHCEFCVSVALSYITTYRSGFFPPEKRWWKFHETVKLRAQGRLLLTSQQIKNKKTHWGHYSSAK